MDGRRESVSQMRCVLLVYILTVQPYSGTLDPYGIILRLRPRIRPGVPYSALYANYTHASPPQHDDVSAQAHCGRCASSATRGVRYFMYAPRIRARAHINAIASSIELHARLTAP